jgi:hypothetical protein
MRPTDHLPRLFIDDLVALERDHPDWFTWKFGDKDSTYVCKLKEDTMSAPLRRMVAMSVSGVDVFTFKAVAAWVAQGPKTFKPTPDICKTFENIDVNITLADYVQPYTAVGVALPKGMYEPYSSAICYWEGAGSAHATGPGPCIMVVLFSPDHQNDITTAIGGFHGHVPIEASLRRFDDDVMAVADVSTRALRVVINSCLALAHFGHTTSPMFPHDLARDHKLAREQSPRGDRARDRLTRVETLVAFRQEVVLTAGHSRTGERGASCGDSVPHDAGGTKATHWRRGHWAMQPCGPGRSERKRIFRPPVLVRADLFAGDVANTSTSYEVM